MNDSADSSRDDLVSASKWMALGTIISRITGFARAFLIVSAIGQKLNGDIFDTANSIPNALYILVAGGVFNVVLVPQLVRAMKNDEDGGDAYANRVVTLGLLVLSTATVLLILLVPLMVRVLFGHDFFTSAFADQKSSALLLMALCMPQVFFYGAFVLVGQILNARGRFGPMMWAPILNNIVSCAMVGVYIVAFGTSRSADGFSTKESLVLGIGSTAGIALQAIILVPYLRRAGFHYRPRFDFRGVGLGHTFRLGMWTLLFIIVNQIAFVTITRIANNANVEAAKSGGGGGGSSAYNFGFLISQVPHGIITVSLATAMMPTLSALASDKLFPRMRLELGRTLRLTLVIVTPLAIAVACLGQQLALVATSFGANKGHTATLGHTIQGFAPAMVFFTVHYVMLRGFYATENTRTPFFVQAILSASNIGFAFALSSLVDPINVSTMLALSFGAAYFVGSVFSATLLSRVIGPVFDSEMWRFVVRMLAACAVAAAIMLAAAYTIDSLLIDKATYAGAALAVFGGGVLGAGGFVLAAKAMRLEELSYLVDTLLRRRAAPQ
ncbi:MAG: murein biosynthesis integral membrane protein MurJ [Aeromicrobium sp.]